MKPLYQVPECMPLTLFFIALFRKRDHTPNMSEKPLSCSLHSFEATAAAFSFDAVFAVA